MFANFKLVTKLLVGAAGSLFTNSHFEITQINTHYPSRPITRELQKFESSFSYPFSNKEYFTIQHGRDGDYFAFFKQLGKPYYYTVTSKRSRTVEKEINGKQQTIKQRVGEVAGAVCCVLRTVKTRNGKSINAWYICDLKVNKKYQGEHLPLKIAQKIAGARFLECPRGYAICMNPAQGEPRAASIFKKHGPFSQLDTQTLNLYTLTAKRIARHRRNIKKQLVRFGYMKKGEKLVFKSTSGAKDYEISDMATHKARPWNLLHMQVGTKAIHEDKNASYMLCAVDGSSLDTYYKKQFGLPSSSAQILSYGMKDVDFNFLTSNQI